MNKHNNLNIMPVKNEVVETSHTDNSKKLIMHHLSSFQANDMKALMIDYTENSVLVTQEAIYKGINEIQGFFKDLMIHFPIQKSAFELDKAIFNEGLAYIVWHATTPTLEVPIGSDTFFIAKDKIFQ